ncbi:hypothetical protein M438DRAFT_383636 [Aureobasidium pullulans EXF-150]|uniref:Uncharacterized protein n=1 Tax=Aureobasidium pullulans EXF-150 TaxID=1043002 RepID=A0A074Y398_AURPU|nr:uncharacterized protein M438DRAFT_383636 [Aureobasidium pullulans EXF-150]KEQ81401.1 hypothetical protein M438DRAFT_383636 [Aureobasidium pullulans EXF-150]
MHKGAKSLTGRSNLLFLLHHDLPMLYHGFSVHNFHAFVELIPDLTTDIILPVVGVGACILPSSWSSNSEAQVTRFPVSSVAAVVVYSKPDILRKGKPVLPVDNCGPAEGLFFVHEDVRMPDECISQVCENVVKLDCLFDVENHSGVIEVGVENIPSWLRGSNSWRGIRRSHLVRRYNSKIERRIGGEERLL